MNAKQLSVRGLAAWFAVLAVILALAPGDCQLSASPPRVSPVITSVPPELCVPMIAKRQLPAVVDGMVPEVAPVIRVA